MHNPTARPLLFSFVLALFVFLGPWNGKAADGPEKVSVVSDPTLGRASQHGMNKLRAALQARNVAVQQTDDIQKADGKMIIVAGVATGSGAASRLLKETGASVPGKPESLLIRKTRWQNKPALLLAGYDDRGLMYALLETVDRLGWAADPANPFSEVQDTMESPSVSERGLSIYTMHRATFEERLFNEEYWASYFDMLARDRFNSFVLIFGYENGGYFAPAYPYFFDVDGFPEVRVVDFTPVQQQRYLRALNRLTQMAHDRGLNFIVGLWDHIYRGGVQSGGVKEADPNKPLSGVPTGLTKTNLMPYSKAALAKFLKLVPEVDAVQFRMHNESGLKAGAEMREFWTNIYQVVNEVRPGLLFDARAKEFPDELIDIALAMGINIRISTKYLAEQMSLPFHPTHINRQNQFDRRHGYADLLRYPQRYNMHWQLWSGGTTRVLLWGDPEYARRFAESTHLYGRSSFEVNEMLATKMEAQPHDMKPFELLNPQYRYYQWEFERYWHFYQVFGRLSYNPDTAPATWQRDFQRRFGPEAAPYLEKALHQASRVLPRINGSIFPYNRFPTTRGWAEKQRWEDLPAYANSEGSDTQQFLSFAEAARGRIEGSDSAKLHPEANSAWFARVSREILDGIEQAEQRVGRYRNKEFDSTVVDLRILAHLASYHARRIHAGLSYALFKQSQDLSELDAAIAGESRAVEAWEQLVQAAGDVYTDDLMMGLRSAGLAGHWRQELVDLKKGLVTLNNQREQFKKQASQPTITHVPVRKRLSGDKLVIRATVLGPAPMKAVRLAWRAGNRDYAYVPMKPSAPSVYHASIPASAKEADVSYYIEVEDNAGVKAIFPKEGANQPIKALAIKDQAPPNLDHTPVRAVALGKPLKITAKVSDPSGLNWVRLRYRGVNQHFDYATLSMSPTGQKDEYQAEVPAEQINPQWDFMYFLEAMDKNGNGKIYPNLDQETPYIVVKLER